MSAVTLPPTPDQIRALSPFLRTFYASPPTDAYQELDLASDVAQAIALVSAITWRIIDPDLGCAAPEGYSCEEVPAALMPVAYDAVTRMTERIAVTSSADYVEQTATGRRLRGFSAGPYSESYFAPGEFSRRGAQTSRPAMDADDMLDLALWALATTDAREYFVANATGQVVPGAEVTAFDYRRQALGYNIGAGYPWGATFGHGGPDGF